jgi:uncharacterized protein DUF1876
MHTGNIHINILTDGNRTVAEASLHTYAAHVTGNGSSGREPGDKSDPKIGENLAIARALRKIANRLEKKAAGTMKHRESIAEHHRQLEENLQNMIDRTLDEQNHKRH